MIDSVRKVFVEIEYALMCADITMIAKETRYVQITDVLEIDARKAQRKMSASKRT